MKLQCDEMLASLARWLRAAGYDSALVPAGTPDADLLADCLREERRLITRDCALAAAAEPLIAVLWLPDRSIDDQARLLAHEAGIDWLHAPFTRCLADNARLQAAPARAVEAPPPFDARPGDIHECPACRRVYWPGGHVRRMRAQLGRWRAASERRA